MTDQRRPARTTTIASSAAALGLALTSLAGGAEPARAASSGASNYAQWAVSGGTGSMTIPVLGFPSASVSTNSSSTQIGSGASAFLNASTPFGAQYGSSQNQPYALLRTASGIRTSTTTLTFATPPTAGSWGFALGDIDADLAQLSATGANGQPVPVTDLGFQSTFNFCQGTPLPSSCKGSTATDKPTWNPATGTLTGNVVDTNGASGWFRPTAALKTLTIKFSAQTGLPVYQLWAAASTRAIGGRVTSSGDCPAPHHEPLALLTAQGDVVTGPDGQAVYTTVGQNGDYEFPELAPGTYQVVAVTPSGYRPVGDTTKTADVSDASVTGLDFAFRCGPAFSPATQIDVPPQGPVEIAIPPTVDPNEPITIIEPPRHGTVVVDEQRDVFVYTPETGYQGRDEFTFEGTGRNGKAVIMTIHLLIGPMLPATGSFGTTQLVSMGLGVAGTGALLSSAALLWRRRRHAISAD